MHSTHLRWNGKHSYLAHSCKIMKSPFGGCTGVTHPHPSWDGQREKVIGVVIEDLVDSCRYKISVSLVCLHEH